MVIENKKAVFRSRLIRLGVVVMVTTLAVLIMYNVFFEDSFLGIEGKWYVVGLVCLYFAYYSWGLIRDDQYFWFSDMGLKLTFRHFKLRPFSAKLNSVEIKKEEFLKFEVKRKIFGARVYLYVYQQLGGNVAKYPPISLSKLTKHQREKLITTLKAYVKK